MICLGPSGFGAAVEEAQCARSPGIQAFLRGVVLSSSPGCSFLFRPPATGNKSDAWRRSGDAADTETLGRMSYDPVDLNRVQDLNPEVTEGGQT